MAMFENEVRGLICSEAFTGVVVSEEFIMTKKGRNVAFIVTQALWYALRVYVEDMDDRGNCTLFSRTEHTSMDGVQNQIQKIKHELSPKKPSHASTCTHWLSKLCSKS